MGMDYGFKVVDIIQFTPSITHRELHSLQFFPFCTATMKKEAILLREIFRTHVVIYQ